jgi:hypothetical protein
MTDRKNTATFSFPSDREIVITRIFDAPRNLVFKTVTDPNLISQWWGPKRFTTTVDNMPSTACIERLCLLRGLFTHLNLKVCQAM